MKIAMIGHKRIPLREGGIEIVVYELSRRLVQQGHEVVAYNRKGHHVSGKQYDTLTKILKKCTIEGIKIIPVPTIERKGLAAVSSSFFASIRAIFGHYDCIHYHAEGPSVMLIIPHILGIRTIATIHGLDWQRSKWGGFATWYLKLGEKMAAKYADEVIVLSKNVQQYFKDTYGRDTVYIPNGINSPEIIQPELIREKWNLSKDEYILFLGRVVPEKGIQYLIKAYKGIETDKKLVIAGGACDTDAFYEEMKNLALDDDRIIFTGFVSGQTLQELYSNAYVYVLPSDLEGMAISLLEAMSYGNCCLVSSISECTEVVMDKAKVFLQGDVESLQMNLKELISDPGTVAKYKDEASTYICSRYDWDVTVEKTINLYNNE